MYFAKLDGHTVIPCTDRDAMLFWLIVHTAREAGNDADDPSRVGRDTVGEWDVSTVFLRTDHGHGEV